MHPAELEAAFRLRYDVYRDLGYIAPCTARLDVDEYDACAIPLGVFDDSGQIVGTLRVLRAEPRPAYARAVARIIAQAADPELTARATRRRTAILPSIASPEIGAMLDDAGGRVMPIYELSRFVVHPDRRGSVIFRALLEFGMAVTWRSGPAMIIGSCLPRHVPMYARHGYRPLRVDNRRDHLASVGQDGCVVICHQEDVPGPARARIAQLGQDFPEGAL